MRLALRQTHLYRELFMVRVAGFEPTVSWTRTKRDTKLRHTRIVSFIIILVLPPSVKRNMGRPREIY